jgi:hypothetical protein
MSLEQKMLDLNAAITASAASLGLKFVNGPDPRAIPAGQALGDDVQAMRGKVSAVNGENRGAILFVVSEA